MATVRLIHWNEDEGLERQKQLEAFGFEAAFDFSEGLAIVLRELRASMPDAVVIDQTRIPSHGREIANALRTSKATRHVPLVFAGGEPEKVAITKKLFPDATFTTWGRIKTALPRAIARPVKDPIVPDHSVLGKPTVAKLGVKPGFKVALLGSPRGMADTLKPWPAKVKLTARAEADADLFLCFAKSVHELAAQLMTVGPIAHRQTLWLAWPKKASQVKSELDGNIVRETGLRAGWVDFKVCSIDAIWSGLAFKRRKGV